MADGLTMPGQVREQQFLPIKPAKNFLALARQEMQEGLPLDKGGIPLESEETAAQLRKVAEDFEAIFLYQLMKQMRSAGTQEKLFHGGPGEDMFMEMMDEELSQKMAKRGSVGIADMLFRQLSRQYGVEDETSLPGLSGSGGVLQQKLQDAQNQIQSRDPQPTQMSF